MLEKVCILLAGRGSRLGDSAQWIHKSLLPVGDRAVLSRIISNFDPMTEFVFAVHHQADQIRDFMAVAHPDIRVTYVEVNSITGPKTGPGASLFACRDHLAGSFYVVCGDTLFDHLPKAKGNWLGVPAQPVEAGQKWCNLQVHNNKVVAIADKLSVQGPNWQPFIGLARIEDRSAYFAALERAIGQASKGEIQLSDGFAGLLDSLFVESVKWQDTGTIEAYLALQGSKNQSRLQKRGELIFFESGRVLRFFSNREIAARRTQRAQALAGLVPPVVAHRGSFYAYNYVPGQTLAATQNLSTWQRVFDLVHRDLWKPADISDSRFKSACHNFYVSKTLERQEKFISNQSTGVALSPLSAVELESLHQELSAHAMPVRIHGDLQPENIIVGDDGAIQFIDWRQDFGGLAVAGDRMWDLAKFNLYLKLNEIALHPQQTAQFIKFLHQLSIDERVLNKLSALALVQMGGIHFGKVGVLYYQTGLTWLRSGQLQSVMYAQQVA